ncbi:hypothetical protein BDP55DRAFT_635324 [Colletotrichum godetiae]|uniref:Uncharacterized protein n=1 Tax=Colletotrichum godetiae TaxID=1209918 RepID=A0AAJ0ADZ0_9PEZI|nr:uncharacterized protein BDP55DRAFT_635324 [Colletotrichum godetiae]KAK1672120.1 hypothetical protein BDP55DRAFT_635324 [Colletotrichum godetiae]
MHQMHFMNHTNSRDEEKIPQKTSDLANLVDISAGSQRKELPGTSGPCPSSHGAIQDDPPKDNEDDDCGSVCTEITRRRNMSRSSVRGQRASRIRQASHVQNPSVLSRAVKANGFFSFVFRAGASSATQIVVRSGQAYVADSHLAVLPQFTK